MSSTEPHLWQKQTSAQRLSNRTILRFQGLADEFKNDLKRILPDRNETIEDVLFVSADRSSGRFDPTGKKRYYNARLLRTCRFIETNTEVWEWIKKCFDRRKDTEWKDNFEGFKQLFKGPDSRQWLEFEKAVTQDDLVTQDNRKDAHDMLINAIADLPYTGFLPSVFDSYAFKNDWCRSSRLTLCRFKVSLNNQNDPVAELTTLDSPSKIYSNRTIKTKKWSENQESLEELYFPRFIDHFVMGRIPNRQDTSNDFFKGPYILEEGSLPQGFFIPVYDFNDEDGSPAGGFEGWLIVDSEMKHEAAIIRLFRRIIGGSQCHDLFMEAIRQVVQSFSSKVVKERMRELEEKDWTDSMTPENFTREHYRCIGGWENEPNRDSEPRFTRFLPAKVPFAYICEGNAACNSEIPERLLVPCDQEESYRFMIWESERKNEWSEDTEFNLSELDLATIKHIIVRTTLETDSQIFLFRKREDTLLPFKDEYLINYGLPVARSVNDLYKSAKMRETERKQSQLSGLLDSGHDYSKELTALDSTFGRLHKAIGDTAGSIKQSLAGRPDFAEFQDKVETDFKLLLKIRDHSLLRSRFMMAHLRTQTEGYYYEQPDWIVKRLANGTRGDIYFLFNHLVWEPLGAKRYLKLLEMPPQTAEVSDWSRLFAYDEVGRHPQVDAFLADYLKQCFLRRPEDGGPMTPEQFGDRHPPPKINPDHGMTDVILPGLRARSIGIRGLLPLVVFSLRAAFQHAWLTSFIRSAADGLDTGILARVPERVTLSEEMTDTSYSLRIEFPNPLAQNILERWPRSRFAVPTAKPEGLPWGNWEREVSFYRGLGLPWVASLMDTGYDEVFCIDIRASRR